MLGYTYKEVEAMKDAISDAWRKEQDRETIEVLRSAHDLLDGLIVEGYIEGEDNN